MTVFCATDASGKGKTFEAASWAAAEAHCEAEGWWLAGRLQMVIPAGPDFTETDASILVAKLNKGAVS